MIQTQKDFSYIYMYMYVYIYIYIYVYIYTTCTRDYKSGVTHRCNVSKGNDGDAEQLLLMYIRLYITGARDYKSGIAHKHSVLKGNDWDAEQVLPSHGRCFWRRFIWFHPRPAGTAFHRESGILPFFSNAFWCVCVRACVWDVSVSVCMCVCAHMRVYIHIYIYTVHSLSHASKCSSFPPPSLFRTIQVPTMNNSPAMLLTCRHLGHISHLRKSLLWGFTERGHGALLWKQAWAFLRKESCIMVLIAEQCIVEWATDFGALLEKGYLLRETFFSPLPPRDFCFGYVVCVKQLHGDIECALSYIHV